MLKLLQLLVALGFSGEHVEHIASLANCGSLELPGQQRRRWAWRPWRPWVERWKGREGRKKGSFWSLIPFQHAGKWCRWWIDGWVDGRCEEVLGFGTPQVSGHALFLFDIWMLIRSLSLSICIHGMCYCHLNLLSMRMAAIQQVCQQQFDIFLVCGLDRGRM